MMINHAIAAMPGPSASTPPSKHFSSAAGLGTVTPTLTKTQLPRHLQCAYIHIYATDKSFRTNKRQSLSKDITFMWSRDGGRYRQYHLEDLLRKINGFSTNEHVLLNICYVNNDDVTEKVMTPVHARKYILLIVSTELRSYLLETSFDD